MHQWTSEGKGDIEPRANCLISLISSNTIVILPLPWFSISMALLSDRLNWLLDSAAEGEESERESVCLMRQTASRSPARSLSRSGTGRRQADKEGGGINETENC